MKVRVALLKSIAEYKLLTEVVEAVLLSQVMWTAADRVDRGLVGDLHRLWGTTNSD